MQGCPINFEWFITVNGLNGQVTWAKFSLELLHKAFVKGQNKDVTLASLLSCFLSHSWISIGHKTVACKPIPHCNWVVKLEKNLMHFSSHFTEVTLSQPPSVNLKLSIGRRARKRFRWSKLEMGSHKHPMSGLIHVEIKFRSRLLSFPQGTKFSPAMQYIDPWMLIKNDWSVGRVTSFWFFNVQTCHSTFSISQIWWQSSLWWYQKSKSQ